MPPLVLATKFNPSFNGLNKAIKKHWHLIEQNDSTKTMFPKPPIIAYKRHKNLKDLLTSSKLQDKPSYRINHNIKDNSYIKS